MPVLTHNTTGHLRRLAAYRQRVKPYHILLSLFAVIVLTATIFRIFNQ